MSGNGNHLTAVSTKGVLKLDSNGKHFVDTNNGAFYELNSPMANLRSVSIVMSDEGSSSYTPLVGDPSQYHFHGHLTAGIMLDALYASPAVSGGTWKKDGVGVDPTTETYPTSPGVVSVITTGSVSGGYISRDRGFGGRELRGRIYEVFLNSADVGATDMESYREHLVEKFLSAGTSLVANTSTLQWDALEGVSQPADLRWNMTAAVSTISTAQWDLLVTVGQAADIRWHMEGVVANSVNFQWDALVGINQSLDARWDLLAALSRSADLRWNILAAISQSADLRWDLIAAVAQNLDARWHILNSVGISADLRWSLLNSVSQTLQPQWSALTSVGSQVDARWDVIARVNQLNSLRWDLLNSVEQALDARWDALAGVSQSSELRWHLIGLVTDSLILQWRVGDTAQPFKHTESITGKSGAASLAGKTSSHRLRGTLSPHQLH